MAARAVVTALDVTAEYRRPTRLDRAHDLALATAQMPGIVIAIRRSMAAEHVRHLDTRPSG